MKKLIAQYKLPAIQILTILVMVIIVMAVIAVTSVFGTYDLFAYGLVLLIGVGMVYGVFVRNFRTPEEKRRIYRNKYHDVFFKGTVIFAVLLTMVGIVFGLVSYIDGGNPYRIVGLLLTVIWVSVFMIYFVWSVYFYNINYGITDEEWEKIEKAKEMTQYGMSAAEEGMKQPMYNPYRSQTFGLPPGTVRGMIAFTLLIGGISLLISSYGMDYVSNAEIALRAKQFEFFETAFLMMIAFYFGDKSLKYLRERWNPENPNKKSTEDTDGDEEENIVPQNASVPGPMDFPTEDPVGLDDRQFMTEERLFTHENQLEGLKKPLTGLKKALTAAPIGLESLGATGSFPAGGAAFVQIRDNANSKLLIDEEIVEALAELKDKKGIDLSLPVIKAVISVESSGRGHLKDGRAKILFEGHKFWLWLSKVGKTTEELEELQKRFPNIIYPKWTTAHYKLGEEEYKRLEKAKEICQGINDKAAVYATSWGLFQILGENLEHNIKSRHYEDWRDFEAKQQEAEYYHFLDFLAFIQTKKVNGKALIEYISEDNKGRYDWASFAFGYNGRGYKVNQYDVKLARAYEKFKGMRG